MTIANAGPSVQDVHAVFDVLGPAFAHGRIARVGDAARTPRPHPASGIRQVEGARRPGHARAGVAGRRARSRAAHRVVGGHAPRRSGPLALPGMRLATGLGLGLVPLT
ncbi:hypothetical protein [Burkholderia cepacia]|uniref:hypothetical protein n=1 Tax=Burkholderia cepacia TaxID=292 RepID=UPI0021488314|nr:hypothetical protein [Burkholderia cepacia]